MTPSGTPQGAFLNCKVNGFECHALLDTVVGLNELEGVLEPLEKFTERYAAGAFRTAVTIKDGRVFNPLNKPLKIYRSSSIGELYPLHGGEELSEEDNVGINYKIVSPGVPESDVGVLPEVKQCGAVQLEDFENCCVSMEEVFPINSDAVPEEEKRRHYEVLATYANCVSRGPMDLGRVKGVKHTIDTGSAEPIQVPPRRVPFPKRRDTPSSG